MWYHHNTLGHDVAGTAVLVWSAAARLLLPGVDGRLQLMLVLLLPAVFRGATAGVGPPLWLMRASRPVAFGDVVALLL